MKNFLSYSLIMLADVFIIFLYFDKFFQHKLNKPLHYLPYLTFYLINILCIFLCVNYEILYIIFVLGNFSLTLFLKGKFSDKIISSLFLSLLKALIGAAAAFVCIIARIDSIDFYINYRSSNFLYLAVYLIVSKIIFLIIISAIASKKDSIKFSVGMLILPFASLVILYFSSRVFSHEAYTAPYSLFFIAVVVIVVLVISNVFMFYIYRKSILNERKIAQLEIENQKQRTKNEYYRLLKKQNEDTKILVHDIKRHLNTIRTISSETKVQNYIDELINEYSVTRSVIDYCNNDTLNLIVNRWNKICSSHQISFNVDIRSAFIDFMQDYDITALFDNLIENAFESALCSESKFIDFIIQKRSNKFVSVTVQNSSNKPLIIKNNKIVSSKQGLFHGIGMNSISRTVKKYDGEMYLNYDNDNNLFSVKIIFKY